MTPNEFVDKMFDGLAKGFYEHWLAHGKPHPNSKAYLDLTRKYYFAKGMEMGPAIDRLESDPLA